MHPRACTEEELQALAAACRDGPPLSPSSIGHAETSACHRTAANNSDCTGLTQDFADRLRIASANEHDIMRDNNHSETANTPAQDLAPPPGLVQPACRESCPPNVTDAETIADTSVMTECSICTEPLSTTATDFCTTACGHKFHTQCILRWNSRQHTRTPSCPLCRAPLQEDLPIYNIHTPGGGSGNDEENPH